MIRSLPCDLANCRKSSVRIAQTVCEPPSRESVLHQPSLNHPVSGSVEHFCNSVPLTFIESCITLLPQLK